MLHKQCVNLLILLSKFTHINVLLWMQNLLKILCKIYTYFFAVLPNKAYGIKVTVYRHPPACVFDTRVKFSLFEFFSLFIFFS